MLARCFRLALVLPALVTAGEIETKFVTYKGGSVQSKGYLALPEGDGPHPGVLVLHEWWGQTDYIRKRADMLAELGYVALAADLYGEGKEGHDPRTARWLMLSATNNSEELGARFSAAMKTLQAQEGVDPDRIAAVGYSSGGTIALQMARNGTRGLDAVVAFHPLPLSVEEPNPPIKELRAKILLFDPKEAVFFHFNHPEARKQFVQEMNAVKADLEIVEYADAMDSFTNPEASKLGEKFRIPLKYDPAADADSWQKLETFLEDLWKEEPAAE